MYICLCNAIREQDVRDLAQQYPDESVEELYARLGAELDCGSCLSFADGVVADAGRALRDPPAPVASDPVAAAA